MNIVDTETPYFAKKKRLSEDLRKKVLLLSTAFMLSVIVTMFISYTLNTSAVALEKEWREYNTHFEKAREALINLTEQAGYGAFIHNYKNYVLRGEEAYLGTAESSVDFIRENIQILRAHLIDLNDKAHIDQIEYTFNKYFEKLSLAKTLVREGMTIEEMDKQLRVDDTGALIAIDLLKREFKEQYKQQVEHTSQSLKTSISLSYYLYTLIIPMILVYLVGLYVSYSNYKIALQSVELADEANIARKTQADFLANMSHEIRTPMNGILGMFTLLSDTGLTNKQLHLVQQGTHSAKALLTVINDILDISKIESGKIELKSEAFELESMLVDVGRLLHANIGDKPVELLCPSNLIVCPRLVGDASRLRQILVNLIGNAIKFTQHGMVSVSADIQQHETFAEVNFTVEDTGIGIKHDIIQNIFNRFEQVDNSLTRSVMGTGLGLTITKELVSLLGGEIKVESTVNVGSRFSFTLPFEIEKTPQPEAKFSTFAHCQVFIYFAGEAYQHFIKELLDAWHIDTIIIDDIHEITKDPLSNKSTKILIADPSLMPAERENAIWHDMKDKEIQLIWVTNLFSATQAYLNVESSEITLAKPIAPSELYNAILKCNGEDVLTANPGNLSPHAIKQLSGDVLLVDDDLINQEVAKALLSKFGLNITVAENGEVALTLLQANKYDVVLMDCMMPVMDGYTATEKLRAGDAGDKNRHTSIIALTADAMEGTAERCLNAGMNDYLTKPLEPLELEKTLSKWLDAST